MSNENLPALSKQYGFGAEHGADPAEAGREGGYQKSNMRAAQRRLMAMEFGPDERITPQLLRERIAPGRNVTGAELAAIARYLLSMALNEHSEKSLARLEDATCGKLPNTSINATIDGKGIADMMNAARERVRRDRERTAAQVKSNA